ncbi:MAG: hypothetical protein M3N52_01380 [Actinomycetota bacterium]|nr:hypothetical protein [Actinomycetota bacterium]
MTRTALVTGSSERVAAVADALEAVGFTVTAVSDRKEVARVCAGFEPGSLDSYVQMPGRILPQGRSVVRRLEEFLTQGLLARYQAAAAVLPALGPHATVVLVTGNHPSESGLPDDQAARVSLLRVLAQAILADTAHTEVRAAVVEQGRSATDIAEIVQQRPPQRLRVVSDYVEEPADISYVDWRLHVLELASTEG